MPEFYQGFSSLLLIDRSRERSPDPNLWIALDYKFPEILGNL